MKTQGASHLCAACHQMQNVHRNIISFVLLQTQYLGTNIRLRIVRYIFSLYKPREGNCYRQTNIRRMATFPSAKRLWESEREKQINKKGQEGRTKNIEKS